MGDSPLPTDREISPTDGLDLDEKSALEHFLGKSVVEAAKLFSEERNLVYAEDLMWMGPRAFAYYLPAVMPYLRSVDSYRDSAFVVSVKGAIQSQLDDDAGAFRPAATAARAFLEHCLAHDDDRLGVEAEGPYRNLRKQLAALLKRVEAADQSKGR
ncbi:MAG: hypothetical protein AAGA20_20325 [Planctomycetota bacterium]